MCNIFWHIAEHCRITWPHSDVIAWKHFPCYWSFVRAENSPVTGEFPTQRPVTRSFDAFCDLRLNKRLSKQSWGWWFETPSCPLWRHCNAAGIPTYSKGWWHTISSDKSHNNLAFVQGIHQWPVNSPHKWSVRRKMFPFDVVIMHKHFLNRVLPWRQK